jgi:hypothetical protein
MPACAACSTVYAVGLAACPHCGSEEIMPKAHANAEPTDASHEDLAEVAEVPAQDLAEVAEVPAEVPVAPFDPGAHTVAEVTAYLDSCDDDDEYDRVVAAELAGKHRKAIVGET